MKNIIITTLVSALFSVSVYAYDANKAQAFDAFYSNFTQKACANSKLFIQPEEAMKLLKEKKAFTFLDVRTKAEKSIVAISAKNAINVELKDLFKKENLAKLPIDRTIVVVCHSGTRAVLAAIGLKQVGIKNTRVLKGGLVGLADANNPKNAPIK